MGAGWGKSFRHRLRRSLKNAGIASQSDPDLVYQDSV